MRLGVDVVAVCPVATGFRLDVVGEPAGNSVRDTVAALAQAVSGVKTLRYSGGGDFNAPPHSHNEGMDLLTGRPCGSGVT